jgi:hypothetical protein
MGTRITDLGSEEFTQLFTSFEHTAYRLELLPAYEVGYERDSFRAFLADQPLPHDPGRDAWGTVVRTAVNAGKIFQRVHVVPDQLTDYLRYEFDIWYTANTAAGDDVRILLASEWPAAAPREDYWLFDSRDLWVMHYADDGSFQHAEAINDIHAGWTVADAGYWRDAALHYATPFRDYVRNRPQMRAS